MTLGLQDYWNKKKRTTLSWLLSTIVMYVSVIVLFLLWYWPLFLTWKQYTRSLVPRVSRRMMESNLAWEARVCRHVIQGGSPNPARANQLISGLGVVWTMTDPAVGHTMVLSSKPARCQPLQFYKRFRLWPYSSLLNDSPKLQSQNEWWFNSCRPRVDWACFVFFQLNSECSYKGIFRLRKFKTPNS